MTKLCTTVLNLSRRLRIFRRAIRTRLRRASSDTPPEAQPAAQATAQRSGADGKLDVHFAQLASPSLNSRYPVGRGEAQKFDQCRILQLIGGADLNVPEQFATAFQKMPGIG